MKLKTITILPFVETKEMLKLLNAEKFITRYLPHIKNVRHKMRGTDGNKKPIAFSETEKQQIIQAIQKFANDVKNPS